MSDEHDEVPMTDAERERLLREQLKQLRVADLAYEMMISLVTIGYQKLGLTDQTRDMRDLPDAHLAIELLKATVDVAERERGAEPFKDLRSTLAQMQLGYVQALRAGDESPAPAGDEEAPGVVDDRGETPDSGTGDRPGPDEGDAVAETGATGEGDGREAESASA